ncbi:hypothetical protein imdm_1086 [gamma proteobacterium IMCC2047]|nr:hypothetical protein imdm_1086 [gamma proteobacterium IMCC2047]
MFCFESHILEISRAEVCPKAQTFCIILFLVNWMMLFP